MSEETYTFEQARARLEDIVSQVRKKDTALEASLDLLEEGVRLANLCTEQIDHTQWREASGEEAAEGAEDDAGAFATVAEAVEETTGADTASEATDAADEDSSVEADVEEDAATVDVAEDHHDASTGDPAEIAPDEDASSEDTVEDA